MQALSLDVQVLTMLLQRNRSQQHRSRYYRRLKLFLSSLKRYRLDNGSFFIGLLSTISGNADWMGYTLDRDSKKRARGFEDKWEIKGSEKNAVGADEEDETQLPNQLSTLSKTLTRHIPEVLSRIMCAAEALYIELSRAYFVPFCTVALASVSRIRSVMMMMGREGCIELGRCLGLVQQIVVNVQSGNGDKKWHGKLSISALHSTIDMIRRENDLNVGVQWGDWTNRLLVSFVEADADKHEKDQQARKKEDVVHRGIRGMGIAFSIDHRRNLQASDYPEADSSTSRDYESDQKMEVDARVLKLDEDDFGECVDIRGEGSTNLVDQIDSSALGRERIGKIDANARILEAMRKHKKEKKQKLKIKGLLHQDGEGIELMGSCTEACSKSKQQASEAKTKTIKKKKKKRKKIRKDVFDDIFDGI